MPSGAKKRKAAKKKKESQSNNHSDPSSASIHPQGDEDAKHQEDKESDAGAEEEIEEKKSLSNPPPVQELKIDSGDKNTVVEDNVVEVEREFKIEGESNKNHQLVEHDDAMRKSCDDGGSSGSSSGGSSDDGSQDIKNSPSAEDTVPVVDLVKISDSLPGKPSEVIHRAPISESGDSVGNTPDVVESVLNENEVEKPSSAEDKVGTSTASAGAALEREEKEYVPSVANTATNPNEYVTQKNDDELTLSQNEPRPTGAKQDIESGVTEPLLAPFQAPVEGTSWKSCCGLFDAFSGSSR